MPIGGIFMWVFFTEYFKNLVGQLGYIGSDD